MVKMKRAVRNIENLSEASGKDQVEVTLYVKEGGGLTK